MRRLVLTDELFALPERFEALTVQVAALVESQQRTEVILQELGRHQLEDRKRLDEAIVGLNSTIARLDETIARLGSTIRRLDTMSDQVAELRGDNLERRYREKAGGYFARLVRRVYPLDTHELAELADDALDAGQIDRAERDDLLNADVVIRGRRWEDGRETYLVVEVSTGLNADDVERAFRRAAVLARLHDTVPVVAGHGISNEGRAAAGARSVAVVLDGATQPRDEEPRAL